MRITAKTKNKVGICLLAILLSSFIFLSIKAAIEWYVATYGKMVSAKVIDVSEVCKPRSKNIKVLVHGKVEVLAIRGFKCRAGEFPLYGSLLLRESEELGIIAIPNNQHETRTIFLLIMAILFSFLIREVMKERKKLVFAE